MERILLRNGIPEPMPRIEGTYLYQTLHVLSLIHISEPTRP